MPRVSIITALYNHEAYIAQAIESVLSQTYDDWEYIIWDDGSKDGSLAIAQRYAEKHRDRIRLFTHAQGANLGQENTRNAALEKSSGELLCILDSDDFYEPRKLEFLVPCFNRREVGLAYGRFEILLNAKGRRQPSGIAHEPQGHVFEALLAENFVGAAATLFRRACVSDGLRFDPAFRTIGEYPLWLKIAHGWEFAHVPEVVSVWRSHGENLGTLLRLEGKKELLRLFERMSQDPEYADAAEPIKSAASRRRYDYAAGLYDALQLKAARSECLKVAADPRSPADVVLKALILGMASYLGKYPNQKLKKCKNMLWKLRHPYG